MTRHGRRGVKLTQDKWKQLKELYDSVDLAIGLVSPSGEDEGRSVNMVLPDPSLHMV